MPNPNSINGTPNIPPAPNDGAPSFSTEYFKDVPFVSDLDNQTPAESAANNEPSTDSDSVTNNEQTNGANQELSFDANAKALVDALQDPTQEVTMSDSKGHALSIPGIAREVMAKVITAAQGIIDHFKTAKTPEDINAMVDQLRNPDAYNEFAQEVFARFQDKIGLPEKGALHSLDEQPYQATSFAQPPEEKPLGLGLDLMDSSAGKTSIDPFSQGLLYSMIDSYKYHLSPVTKRQLIEEDYAMHDRSIEFGLAPMHETDFEMHADKSTDPNPATSNDFPGNNPNQA